jgi:coenzyme F420-dependent glucose-6-phosphate dehydrogenase
MLDINLCDKLGYWASQEQYSMKDLFEFVKEAEKAGFDQTLTSDHFHPGSHNGDYGNFTWVWLAAVAERTKNMKFIMELLQLYIDIILL